MNVKLDNNPKVVAAAALLLKAAGMVTTASDACKRFEDGGRTSSGVVIELATRDGHANRFPLASTNELIAAIKLIPADGTRDLVLNIADQCSAERIVLLEKVREAAEKLAAGIKPVPGHPIPWEVKELNDALQRASQPRSAP